MARATPTPTATPTAPPPAAPPAALGEAERAREGGASPTPNAVQPRGAPWPPLAVLPLSLRNVRFLLQVALPQPILDLPAALALLAYQHQRKVAAYRSHRKRLLTHLARPG